MSYLVPPRIILPSVREAEIKIGDDFVLVCYASGDPTPNITWTREGFSAIESIGTGNFLRLVNVSRMSAGLYKCTAGNGYGNNATSLTIVSIICKCLISFVLRRIKVLVMLVDATELLCILVYIVHDIRTNHIMEYLLL